MKNTENGQAAILAVATGSAENADTAATIADFKPPLKVGDRFRSIKTPAHYGYQVVERVEENGVVGAHHLSDGARGGHVCFFWNHERGNYLGGYVRL